jgi:hypothetical protein
MAEMFDDICTSGMICCSENGICFNEVCGMTARLEVPL